MWEAFTTAAALTVEAWCSVCISAWWSNSVLPAEEEICALVLWTANCAIFALHNLLDSASFKWNSLLPLSNESSKSVLLDILIAKRVTAAKWYSQWNMILQAVVVDKSWQSGFYMAKQIWICTAMISGENHQGSMATKELFWGFLLSIVPSV